jgi:hypothetical protein
MVSSTLKSNGLETAADGGDDVFDDEFDDGFDVQDGMKEVDKNEAEAAENKRLV